MKTKVKNILTALLLVLLIQTAGAATDSVVALVQGGSIGDFVDTPSAFTHSGFTDFSVDVKIRSDGSAVGEFVCAIPGVVVFGGQARTGQVNADGTVTIRGVEYGYDVFNGGGYTGCPFAVVIHAGGPGLGWFTFRDCVFPAGTFDSERVRVGTIYITHF